MAIDLADIAAGRGGFVIHGEDADDQSGFSVASAGDVNGDGFDDVIIGARYADGVANAELSAGSSYVVFGHAGGFAAAIELAQVAQGRGGFVIHGQDRGDFSGVAVASAGDVNGDGFDDLIIGADGANGAGNAERDAGAGYVVFGHAGGFPAAINLGQIALGQGGFIIHGEDANDQSGRSVASAGDVNGDGFDDLIIGAHFADGAGNAEIYAGSSYVVFGDAGDFATAIDLGEVAQGQGGFVIQGEDFNDRSGNSVASAGDVNGDGFDDLIIGAYRAVGAGNDKPYAGRSYVVFGHESGFPAALDLAQVALGQGGFVIHGEDRYDGSGSSVAPAGDVNGDGFEDLIIGARFADGAGNAEDYAGSSYVVFGQDGSFPAVIDLGQIALGQGGFVIHGECANDASGRSVASAGDINGDGFDDLIIGAFRADGTGNAELSAGSSYVVFGRGGGFEAEIDLGEVAQGQGSFVIQGEDERDYSGESVASAGDVDGDGFDDLIIGARFADGAGNATRSAGASYVVFGGPFLDGPDPTLGAGAGDHFDGTAAADAFDGRAGRDTLSGAVGDDTLAGGNGNDRLRGHRGDDLLAGGRNKDLLSGGAGTDTIAGGQGEDRFRFLDAGDGADLILDFAPGEDRIEISAAGFGGGLTAGIDLGATGRFVANAAGTTTSAGGVGQFVHDTDDALLLWDADGAGGAGPVLIATLDDASALAAADLHIIA